MIRHPIVSLLQIVAIIVSAGLLWRVSYDSPLAILREWDARETLGLIAIFLLPAAIFYLCRRIRTRNAVPALALLSLVLTHFNLAAVVAVGFFALVAVVIGRKVTTGLEWARSDVPLHLAAGYAVMVGGLQLSVHFPVNSQATLILVALLVLALLRQETRNVLSELVGWLEQPFRGPRPGFSLAVATALCVLLLAAFPETHSDALIANLRVAHQVQVNGMWSFSTELYSWVAWPKGAAWLQMAHYLLAGEQGARLFNGAVVLITATLIVREAGRLGFASWAWQASALFLSTPIVFWCAFVMFDDAVFGLFVSAAVVTAVNTSAMLRPRGLFLTLLLGAAASATKITGMLLMPALLVIYLIRFVAGRMVILGLSSWAGCGKYVLAGLPLLGIAAFTYIYAYFSIGNPVFPLYNDIFKAEGYPAIRFQDLRWSAPFVWDAIYRMAAVTSGFMEGRNWTFGLQHALFLIPVIVELVRRRKNLALLQYVAALLVFSMLVFSQMRYVRYLYPILPIYALLLASFLDNWDSLRTQWLFRIGLMMVIALNLINIKSLNMYYRFDLKPLSGSDTRRFNDYFEKSLNQTVNLEYGTFSRVLYLHRPYNAGLDGAALNYHWASPTILAAVNTVTGANDAVEMIRKFGITHVIMDQGVAETAPSPFSRAVASVACLQRQVGSAQLWKVDRSFVLADKPIRLNDRYAKDYLVSGWREPEPWGVWAYGDSARISMHILNRDSDSPVRVKAFAMPYTPNGRTDQHKFGFFVNGHFLQEVTMRPQQVQQELSFEVPAALMRSDGTFGIELRFPRAFDGTQLQLGLSEITLEYR